MRRNLGGNLKRVHSLTGRPGGIAWHNAYPVLMVLLLGTIMNGGCMKQNDLQVNGLNDSQKHLSVFDAKGNGDYMQYNLVSDTVGYNAVLIDPTLKNAWGITINPNGIFWINANGTDNSEVYSKDGVPKRLPVSVPEASGVLFNSTTDFVIPATKQVSRFIFASEDGKIYAWASGDSGRTVVDRSSFNAVYKGIELANDGNANYLFATDFHNGKIDVFDKDFNLVMTKPFMDETIPAGFAPFNIRLIDNRLFVTYAKQLAPDNHDDDKGPGNGFVNIFRTDGSRVRRLISHGPLNSPWGIEKVASTNGHEDGIILVANFGDGHINRFNEEDGEFLGPLREKGEPVAIDGLWGITFPDGRVPGDNPDKLYFTAGPSSESHGLFGYLIK